MTRGRSCNDDCGDTIQVATYSTFIVLVYIATCTHMCAYLQIHTHTCVHTYAETYAHTHIHTHLSTKIRTYTYMRTQLSTNIRTYTYTYIQTNINTYVHYYVIHTHTYEHPQAQTKYVERYAIAPGMTRAAEQKRWFDAHNKMCHNSAATRSEVRTLVDVVSAKRHHLWRVAENDAPHARLFVNLKLGRVREPHELRRRCGACGCCLC